MTNSFTLYLLPLKILGKLVCSVLWIFEEYFVDPFLQRLFFFSPETLNADCFERIPEVERVLQSVMKQGHVLCRKETASSLKSSLCHAFGNQ